MDGVRGEGKMQGIFREEIIKGPREKKMVNRCSQVTKILKHIEIISCMSNSICASFTQSHNKDSRKMMSQVVWGDESLRIPNLTLTAQFDKYETLKLELPPCLVIKCLTVNLWSLACQASHSIGISREEYWSGLSLLLQGIFLTQGSNLHFFRLLLLQVDFLH